MANKKNLISLFSEPISKTYWLRCKHQNLWLQRKLSCFLRKERILRYLCVLDSKLSWTHHITYISTKISKSLGVLARLRHFVLSSTLLNICRSLVQPYLPYGIAGGVGHGPGDQFCPITSLQMADWFFHLCAGSVFDFRRLSRYDQSIKTDIGKPFDKSISIDNF